MADQPDNLFEGNKLVETPPTEGLDPNAKYVDLLKGIKNERGEPKYDTLDKALEALRYSQEFIPELKTKLSDRERELDELKGKVSQFENIEDVVARLANRKPEGEGNPPATSGLDEKAVIDLVQKSLVQNKQSEQIASNMDKVSKTLLQKFGEKTKEAIAAKAGELGMSSEELGQLAAKHPELVLKHFDVDARNINPIGAGHNIPPIKKTNDDIPIPSKPLLSQGTTKEREDHMKLIRERIYSKHGITE